MTTRSDLVTGPRPGHRGTYRRRRRLPPAFTEFFKELFELLLDSFRVHPSYNVADVERKLILLWMKWCILEAKKNGEQSTDCAKQEAMAFQPAEQAPDTLGGSQPGD